MIDDLIERLRAMAKDSIGDAVADEMERMQRQLAAKDALLVKARDLLERLDRADDDRCFLNGPEIDALEVTITAITKELK